MSEKTKIAEKKKIGFRYISLIVIIIVLVFVFGMLNNKFFGISNLTNIVRQAAVMAILSIGMTFVIITGGIDLSVGSNIALGGAIGVWAYNMTNSTLVAVLITILACTIVGLINGIMIGHFHITAFIATLAMQSAARGMTMLVTNAGAMKIENSFYKFISQGNILGIPVIFFILVILFSIFGFVCNGTVIGKQFLAVGGNPTAAYAMGISVKRRLISAYVLLGLLAGFAAIVTVGRVSSAQPYAGQGTEFDVIIAVVVGGTSLAGGSGTMLGTVLGCIIMGIISNGMGLQSTQPFAEYMIKGLLILIAVYADIKINDRRKMKLTPAVEKEEQKYQEAAGVLEQIWKEKEHTVLLKNIVKAFPGMRALDGVSLEVKSGSVMALMGENGAGKSTLMKILAGEEKPTDGAVFINGNYIDMSSPAKASAAGIAMIHQEFSLVGEMNVYQNIFLCNELNSKVPKILDEKGMEEKARELLHRVGRDIDPKKLVKDLTVSEQQMVEIAKILARNAWLIILDEPTSSLTEIEKEYLFKTMRSLKEEGVSMIYISHRMQEIFEIADEITVLRDGQFVSTGAISEYSEQRLIKEMVGRELNNIFDREKTEIGEIVLEVKNLHREGVFEDISFNVHAGEVVGFTGLMGAGRTEVAKAIFGIDNYDSGELFLNGKEIHVKKPSDAINAGIAYVPEDRRLEGFIPEMSIKNNLCIPSYSKIQRLGVIIGEEEDKISKKYIQDLNIKTTNADKYVVELSGGNQQKVSLGKWLAIKPKVLILDEPTRGIDVGAKAEIHKIIAAVARAGVAVILISSELPEIIGCVDRTIVLRGGRITGQFAGEELDQNTIMEKAAYTSK